MYEFLSWLRFVEYDENIALIYQYKGAAISEAQKKKKHEDSDSDGEDDQSKGFKAKDLPPLSIRNEKKILEKIEMMSREALSKYPNDLAEDLEILKRKDLTFN